MEEEHYALISDALENLINVQTCSQLNPSDIEEGEQ